MVLTCKKPLEHRAVTSAFEQEKYGLQQTSAKFQRDFADMSADIYI